MFIAFKWGWHKTQQENSYESNLASNKQKLIIKEYENLSQNVVKDPLSLAHQGPIRAGPHQAGGPGVESGPLPFEGPPVALRVAHTIHPVLELQALRDLLNTLFDFTRLFCGVLRVPACDLRESGPCGPMVSCVTIDVVRVWWSIFRVVLFVVHCMV